MGNLDAVLERIAEALDDAEGETLTPALSRRARVVTGTKIVDRGFR
jgi:hypothetical protein